MGSLLADYRCYPSGQIAEAALLAELMPVVLASIMTDLRVIGVARARRHGIRLLGVSLLHIVSNHPPPLLLRNGHGHGVRSTWTLTAPWLAGDTLRGATSVPWPWTPPS